MRTKHANARGQQRGIPRLIDKLLDVYGHEQHDGHGATVVFLNKASVRQMERDFGRRPVSRLAEWLDVYKVEGSDGMTITVGHRTKRLWR